MSLKGRLFFNLLKPARPHTWLLEVVLSRGLSRNQTRQLSKKFLYIRLFLMFLILFSNQRGRFSGWGVLFPPLSTQRGMEPQRLALIDVSSGCVYQTTMLSAPRAFGLFVVCGKSLCPKRPEDMEDWSTRFRVFIHEHAVCSPVAPAVCLSSQGEEMFWPPCPAVRDCWFQGWSSHQMVHGTANIFKCLVWNFFNLSLLELCKSEVSGL